jgi:hypothetical protein
LEFEMSKPKTGFMCRTDFEHELTYVACTTIYADLEDVKCFRKCWEECGIVEVEVSVLRVVTEGTI